jgi:hypothetical protein
MIVYSGHEGKYRTCCTCDHRDIWRCVIDSHYVGYLNCTDNWCKHWTDKEYKKLFDDNGIRKGGGTDD